MLEKRKLLLRIEPGDEVYLKNTFERIFSKKINLLFNKNMRCFEGQRVRITAVIVTHLEEGHLYSFVAKRINGSKECERFPLICIDRSQPLIRNNRKVQLKNKELYINLGS